MPLSIQYLLMIVFTSLFGYLAYYFTEKYYFKLGQDEKTNELNKWFNNFQSVFFRNSSDHYAENMKDLTEDLV